MITPTHLLDTNTWIYALKGQPTALVARLGAVDPASVAFCSVIKAELLHGAYRYGNQERRLALLHALFSRHTLLPSMTVPPRSMAASAMNWKPKGRSSGR